MRRSGRTFKPRVRGSSPRAGTKIEFKIVKPGSTTGRRIASVLPMARESREFKVGLDTRPTASAAVETNSTKTG